MTDALDLKIKLRNEIEEKIADDPLSAAQTVVNVLAELESVIALVNINLLPLPDGNYIIKTLANARDELMKMKDF